MPPEGDIYTVLTANSSFSSFLKYVNIAALKNQLENPTPTTREYKFHDLGRCEPRVNIQMSRDAWRYDRVGRFFHS